MNFFIVSIDVKQQQQQQQYQQQQKQQTAMADVFRDFTSTMQGN